jgi:hypothetical protein
MDSEGIALASDTRRDCTAALLAITNGRTEEAAGIISALGQRSWKIVQGAKMSAEVADEDRFDLAALKVDMRSEAPEHEA